MFFSAKRYLSIPIALVSAVTLLASVIGLFQVDRNRIVHAAAVDRCFVETTGDNITDFSSVDESALQEAVDAASPGDIIKIAGSCAGVHLRKTLRQTVYVSQSLTLQGGFTETNWTADPNPETYLTILDAQNTGRVVYFTGTVTLTLQNLAIQHGMIGAYGAGIAHLSEAHTPTLIISRSLVYSNTATNFSDGYGGGIYMADYASVHIAHSKILENYSAYSGGGIDAENHVKLIVDNSMITSNKASVDGGGIYLEGGNVLHLSNSKVNQNEAVGQMHDGGGLFVDGEFENYIWITDTLFSGNIGDSNGGGISLDSSLSGNTRLSVYNSIIEGNIAEYEGGGIHVEANAAVSIDRTTIDGNSAMEGGGIFVDRLGALSLRNSTVSSNSAGYGGAIFSADALYVSYSTIANNAAITDTGGVKLVTSTLGTTGTIDLSSSIIADNGAANCSYAVPGTLTDGGYNLDSGNSCGLNATGSLTNTDPLLGPLTDNGGDTPTHKLLAGSEAIDHIPDGANGCGTTVTSDQRDFSRPQDGDLDGVAWCDIGAVERSLWRIYLPVIFS